MKTNTLTKISKSVYASNVYPRLPMALCLVLFTLGLGLSVNAEVERRRTITTFDAPGAGTEAGQGTFGVGLTPNREIEGVYVDASGVLHGYVRSNRGTFTTFDVPAAGTGAGQGTIPLDNNNLNAITGESIDGGNVIHGFLVEGL